MKKILAAILFIPTVASAQYWSGNKLFSNINSSSDVERIVALGYVMGVSDTGQNKSHCSGTSVTAGQTRDVVKQYLERYPSIRDWPADLLVTLALAESWPCPKNNKKGSNS